MRCCGVDVENILSISNVDKWQIIVLQIAHHGYIFFHKPLTVLCLALWICVVRATLLQSVRSSFYASLSSLPAAFCLPPSCHGNTSLRSTTDVLIAKANGKRFIPLCWVHSCCVLFAPNVLRFSLPPLLAGSVSSANTLREESVKITEKRNRAFASQILEKCERRPEMDPGIDIMLWRSAWGKFCFTFAGRKREIALWVPRAPGREEKLSHVNINTVGRNGCLTSLADLAKGGLAKYFHTPNMAQTVAENPP